MKPRIAVSVSFEAPDPNRHLFKGKPLQYIEQGIVHSVYAAEGIPLLVPYWGGMPEGKNCEELLNGFQGLLLTGGLDISPRSYGQQANATEWEGDPERDQYEIDLFREAHRRGLPVLGICRGCQLMNVALGGSLYQDLPSEKPETLPHRDQELYDRLMHPIVLEPEGILGRALGRDECSWIEVNSVHHQAVRGVGEGLRVTAKAQDGVIEALEGEEGYLLGVQWHPEWLPPDHLLGRRVFETFIQACV
ncbi:MAG TPA: gamma-glutamyl-gamma-aminobutyrate hydrolase family protein [Planctomycetes bacterium]|nr:gamma-glutamyl-gamma-aminobutyrate hydrolase family protein [Planctomycetota bacterium]